MSLSDLDGLAGLAALVNSLILWPLIRSIRTAVLDHHNRLLALEKERTRGPVDPGPR